MSEKPTEDRFANMTLEELEKECDRLGCYALEIAVKCANLREELERYDAAQTIAYKLFVEAKAKYLRRKIESPGGAHYPVGGEGHGQG